MSETSDILVQIPDDHLPKLATLYEQKASWAPYMITLVHTGIKLKKSDKYKDMVTILSPNNSWEKDGTVIIIIQLYCQDIYVFTLDDACTNLYKGLSESKLIEYRDRRSIFYAVHEKHVPIIRRFLEENNITIVTEMECYLYGLPPEESTKFTIECPSDVRIKPLQPSNGIQINNVWPVRFKDSDKYISTLIEINGGVGVFLKSNNQMVTWLCRHVFGNMTSLQTEEGHFRKGYASLVVKVLAREIGEEGYWALLTVFRTNRAAWGLFEKLGFRRLNECSFFVTQ